MRHIVLTEEQLRVIGNSTEPLEMRDANGRPVARAEPYTPEELAVIARVKQNRSGERQYVTGAEIQAHLKRLEEIDAQEPLNEERALELLRRMRAGEQV